MKKGYLKTLISLTVACLLVCTSLVSFALSATTETTYNAAAGTVTATTTVTGAGDEEVAFLVHNSADANISASEIVYVDQKTGATSFTFTTDADNAKGAGSKVLVASTSTAAVNGGEVKLDEYSVTYSAENGTVRAALTESASLEAEGAVDTYDYITFYFYPNAGYTVTGMTATKNGAAVDATVAGDAAFKTYLVNAASEFVFEFAAVDESAAPAAPAAATSATFTEAEGVKTAAILATASTGATNFGIIISDDAEAINAAADLNAAGIVVAPAAAANAKGQFGIELIDDSAANNGEYAYFTANTYYAKVFAANTQGVAFGDVIELTIAE